MNKKIKNITILIVLIALTSFFNINGVNAAACPIGNRDMNSWDFQVTKDNMTSLYATVVLNFQKVICCESGGNQTLQKKCDFYIFNGKDKKQLVKPGDIMYKPQVAKCFADTDKGKWLFDYSRSFVPYDLTETNEMFKVCCSQSGMNYNCDYYVDKVWSEKNEYKIIRDPNVNYGDEEKDPEKQENGCSILGENMTPIIKWIIRLIQIALPVLIILLTIFDFASVVLVGEEKNFKAVLSKLAKRLLIGIAIVLLPQLLVFIIDLSGALVPYGIDKGNLYCSLF